MKFDSRHLSSTLRSVAMVVLVLATVAPATWAQKDMGNIVGSVNDGTGAVVADAKVTMTDVDHGTVFNTSTNSSGEYVAGPLKIGRYRVTVEKTGFKKAVAGPVTLNVQDRLAVNVTLQVGTPQFGQLQAARDPRFIQLALKLYF